MTKLLIMVAAITGTYFLFQKYLPALWEQGFHVQGYFISWPLIAMIAMGFMVWQVKVE